MNNYQRSVCASGKGIKMEFLIKKNKSMHASTNFLRQNVKER